MSETSGIGLSQRWRDRSTFGVVNSGRIDPREFGVEPIRQDIARRFCEQHHYAGDMPPPVEIYGLMRKTGVGPSRLVGVCVLSVGMSNATVPKYTGLPRQSGVELGRLVLLDEVAANGESWLVARAMRMLRQARPAVRAVVSYADPVARRHLDGRVIKPGHFGIIYQALNAVCGGRSRRRHVWLTRTGHVISERLIQKIRNDERGAAYSARKLLAAGAPEREFGESPADWVRRALGSGPFVRHLHRGCYVYAWGLDREARASVAIRNARQSYPKPAEVVPEIIDLAA